MILENIPSNVYRTLYSFIIMTVQYIMHITHITLEE